MTSPISSADARIRAAPPPVNDRADILLLESIHPVAEAVLEEHGLRVHRHEGALAGADLAGALAGMQAVGIRSKTRIPAEALAGAGDLLGIGCFCIGTNQVDLAEACRRGVAVFNSPFSNTRSVAELTIAEIVALHRRLVEKSMSMHDGTWDKSALHAHEVRGRRLGIVGYGHIGSQVSVLAEAFGMSVSYHDIAPKLPLGNARPCESLDELLATSDVVTLHVPATPLTEGLIGERELRLMKPGAFLINNARGSVVDLAALRAALETGHLLGAATDVYPAEPERSCGPFTCELAGLPNVILTPHIAGSTEEAQEQIARDVALKLARFLRHGTTTSAVNVPEVELPKLRPDQHRVLHIHRNVPGVLGRINGVVGEMGVNINAEHLQSNAEVSYVILDVDQGHGEMIRAGLEAIPETIRVRALWD
jgi:D-3-phosphoglycerate dehydrogenase